jgi:hypothetical protein
MKQQENNVVKVKAKIRKLPGNVKVTVGESMIKKLEHAQAISASIKGFKK